MEYRELLKYALTGLLIRIDAEEKKLQKATDQQRKDQLQTRIDTMKSQYNDLLEKLRGLFYDL